MSVKHLIEGRYRQLFASASKTPTPEALAQARALRRMGSAWECLQSCIQMDEEDIAAGPGRALADAAMALLDEPEARQGALAELALMSLRADRPALWSFCRAHGFDPEDDHEPAPMRWPRMRMEDEPSSWICRAMRHKAWACVEMLAALPEGRIGLPEPLPPIAETPPAATGSKKTGKRRQVDPADEAYMRALETEWEAQWWTMGHPALFEWVGEINGEDPMPASAKKALAEHGFGPRFGVPAFDAAAARLALDGSAKALRACIEAKIDSSLGLPPNSGGRGLSDLYERPASLAIRGGLLGDAGAAKTWAKAKAWIDQGMGPGAADAMVHDAAILALRGWEPNANSWGRRGDDVGKALAWLATHGPARPEAAPAELALLQNLAIEIAEADKAKPRAEAALVAALMDQWSQAIAGPAKPRRLLKA